MSLSELIRLRVTVHRLGVPEVKLVWPCSPSHNLTVANLLAQIDAVVPLEAGEWGLEDYALELDDGRGGRYECLHFQQVGQALRDEDQLLYVSTPSSPAASSLFSPPRCPSTFAIRNYNHGH